MTACFEKPERSCYNLTHYARLVPECHVIFITPPGCSRIIRLSAIEEGVSDRFTIFNLEQADVIAGSVEDIFVEGVQQTIDRLTDEDRRPKVAWRLTTRPRASATFRWASRSTSARRQSSPAP